MFSLSAQVSIYLFYLFKNDLGLSIDTQDVEANFDSCQNKNVCLFSDKFGTVFILRIRVFASFV